MNTIVITTFYQLVNKKFSLGILILNIFDNIY